MQDGMVYVPLDFWIQLAEYIVDVERVRQTVEAVK